MHGYNSKNLASSFRTVRKNTIQIAEEIPEEKYNFQPAPGTRTVAQTLAHITVVPRFGKRMHSERLTPSFELFRNAMERMRREEAELTTKAAILAALRKDGDEFATWLETLSDEFLAEKVHFPPPIDPPTKTRFEMLLSAKEHEMHHRGQLMLVERMFGIVPHLTRELEARRAEFEKQQASAGRA